MKINERYLWIAGIILAGFVAQNQFTNNNNLRTLLQSYEVETNIQNAQINDFSNQLTVVTAESYSAGFEAGKTQAGIALARGGSLYDYTEGYHAAIGQNIEESEILDVSEGILNELSTLRKMVPRLLNQNNTLQSNLDSIIDSNYALEMLIQTLDNEEEIDNTYLGIIDTLLEQEVYSVPVGALVPDPPRFPTKGIVKQKEQ